MDLVQMLADATKQTNAKCPFKQAVPKGKKSLGAAPPHLKGVFILLASLHKAKRRGDSEAVSQMLGRALGEHFKAALDARRKKGAPPFAGFNCAKDWKVYFNEPEIVRFVTLVR